MLGGDDDEWLFWRLLLSFGFLAILFFLCPFLLLKDGEFFLFLSFDTIFLVIA
jgi:hypothetical protein